MKMLFCACLVVFSGICGYPQTNEQDEESRPNLPTTFKVDFLAVVNNYPSFLSSITHSVGPQVRLSHEFGPVLGVEVFERSDSDPVTNFSGFLVKEEIRFVSRSELLGKDLFPYFGIGGMFRHVKVIDKNPIIDHGSYRESIDEELTYRNRYWAGYYTLGFEAIYTDFIVIDASLGVGYWGYKSTGIPEGGADFQFSDDTRASRAMGVASLKLGFLLNQNWRDK